MQLPEAMRKRISNLMQEKDIKTINAVVNLAGISNSLHDFMIGKAELLQIDTILHICEGFNIQLYEFFQDPLFIDVQYEKPNNNVEDKQ